MAKNFVRDEVSLSRFGVLVAQLESIVASAAYKSPDPLLCSDLLSNLISTIDEKSKLEIRLANSLGIVQDVGEHHLFMLPECYTQQVNHSNMVYNFQNNGTQGCTTATSFSVSRYKQTKECRLDTQNLESGRSHFFDDNFAWWYKHSC